LKKASFETSGILFDVDPGGKHQDRNTQEIRAEPSALQKSSAVHDWHFPVQKDEVRFFLLQEIDCVLPVASHSALVPFVVQQPRQRFTKFRCVIDDKNFRKGLSHAIETFGLE
jgi:hypothetical protein